MFVIYSWAIVRSIFTPACKEAVFLPKKVAVPYHDLKHVIFNILLLFERCSSLSVTKSCHLFTEPHLFLRFIAECELLFNQLVVEFAIFKTRKILAGRHFRFVALFRKKVFHASTKKTCTHFFSKNLEY